MIFKTLFKKLAEEVFRHVEGLLPKAATTQSAGLVKIGDGLSVTPDGVISAAAAAASCAIEEMKNLNLTGAWVKKVAKMILTEEQFEQIEVNQIDDNESIVDILQGLEPGMIYNNYNAIQNLVYQFSLIKAMLEGVEKISPIYLNALLNLPDISDNIKNYLFCSSCNGLIINNLITYGGG